MRFLTAALLIAVTGVFGLSAQAVGDFWDSPDAYLGQPRPGDVPVVFAPGIVSTPDRYAATISFSPDGQKCLFYINDWPKSYAYYTEFKDGKWTAPVKAWFSETRYVDEPIFSLDGKRIYYSSNDEDTQADIYYLEWTGSSWSDPTKLPMSSRKDEFHPCLVADGSIYFTDAQGFPSVCRFVDGKYQARQRLPGVITKKEKPSDWSDAYIAPDESLIIFNASRQGGVGGADNYVSFRQPDGSWGEPKNLGPTINTKYKDYSADLSPDGKYLFFGSNGNLYWVKSDFLKDLR